MQSILRNKKRMAKEDDTNYEIVMRNKAIMATNEYDAVDIIEELIIEKYIWDASVDFSQFKTILTKKFGIEGWKRILSAANEKARRSSADISSGDHVVPDEIDCTARPTKARLARTAVMKTRSASKPVNEIK
jgi:hypothetical protein